MPKIARTCQSCRATFDVWPAWVRKGGGKYCSKQCADIGIRSTLSMQVGEYRQKITKQPESHRLIPVGYNNQALVSIEDFEYLSRFNWTYVANGYARRQWRTKRKTNYEYCIRLCIDDLLVRIHTSAISTTRIVSG